MRLSLYPVAALLLIGLHAQPAPHFDVASVKVNNQPFLSTRPTRSGGRITWTTDLWYLLGYAYNMQPWRMSGPIPGSDHLYDVEATTNPATTDDQLRLMLQALLVERFKMQTHLVTKEAVDGFVLTVAKGGPKMELAPAAEDPAKSDERVSASGPSPGVIGIQGRRATMLALTETLQRMLRTIVVDQTGLTGKYVFEFQHSTGDRVDVQLPDLFSAVKPLGLRLNNYKGSVEFLVVDHIERIPVEN